MTTQHTQGKFIQLILPDIRKDLREDRKQTLQDTFSQLHPSDQADIVRELSQDEVQHLLNILDTTSVVEALEKLQINEQTSIIQHLPSKTASDTLEQMAADERVDIIKRLPEKRRTTLLDRLPETEKEDIEELAQHREKTAGAIMTSDCAYLPCDITVEEGIDLVRSFAKEPEQLYYLYLVNEHKQLVGIASMRDLLQSTGDTLLENIAQKEIISVQASQDQEEVAKILKKYDFFALPVVNEQQQLLGIVTADDVMDVAEEEASEDFQRLGGSEPLERPYFDLSVFRISRKRVGWLLLLFLGGTLTSTVIGAYENELDQVLILSYFIPLLIGTGGNAGAQSVSTMIRAIALDEVSWEDTFRVIGKEFMSGMIVGTILGIVGYGFVQLVWNTTHPVAFVVACSFPLICTWANVVAGVVPIMADHIGIDPTVISAPLITTVVDATGLIMYFSLATWILGL